MAFSKMQREFFDNADHRYNIKTGATRSGKTYMDYFVIPKRIRSRVGKDGLVVVLGVTKSTIERNLLEPMRNLWGSQLVGVINSENKCRLFGEMVYCLGAEKGSQVSKLRGSSIKYCYGDEMADWNPEVFELLKSRLDKPYSCLDGSLNPKSPYHWLKDFLDSDADIYQQKYTIFDNPFLDKSFVENLCKEYEGTVYYKRYILGEWALAEGIIYDMFSEDKHVLKPQEIHIGPGAKYVSCDYGTQNAMVFLLWEPRLEGGYVATREYYYSGRDETKQKTDEQYVADLRGFLGETQADEIIVDPSAASFIAALRNAGYRVTKAKNNVEDGIREVARRLNIGALFISSDCDHTIREFHSYVWDEKSVEHGKDVPLKEHDHCMDAVRYFVYTILAKPRPKLRTYSGGI